MRDAFTMGGRIPVQYRYYDNVPRKPLVLTQERVDAKIERTRNGGGIGYSYATMELRRALARWPIAGMRVAVVGCERPDYPAFCLAFGARNVTVIDRNRIVSECRQVDAITRGEWEGKRFDAVVSMSMLDHDGLGRYGDPVDPNADLKAMQWLIDILRPGGVLHITVAVGEDCLVWNRGRIYGRIRSSVLLEGRNVLYAPSAFDQMDKADWISPAYPLFSIGS